MEQSERESSRLVLIEWTCLQEPHGGSPFPARVIPPCLIKLSVECYALKATKIADVSRFEGSDYGRPRAGRLSCKSPGDDAESAGRARNDLNSDRVLSELSMRICPKGKCSDETVCIRLQG